MVPRLVPHELLGLPEDNARGDQGRNRDRVPLGIIATVVEMDEVV